MSNKKQIMSKPSELFKLNKVYSYTDIISICEKHGYVFYTISYENQELIGEDFLIAWKGNDQSNTKVSFVLNSYVTNFGCHYKCIYLND